MTTVAEIESAVEELPRESVQELADWIVEYQSTLNASADIFRQYSEEETDLESQWVGDK